jgi:hypothetical protein
LELRVGMNEMIGMGCRIDESLRLSFAVW